MDFLMKLTKPITTYRQRIHGDPRRDYAGEWKRWRKEHLWTQKQMALAVDLSRHTIVNIERGYHPPGATSRERMRQLQKRYREADLYRTKYASYSVPQ